MYYATLALNESSEFSDSENDDDEDYLFTIADEEKVSCHFFYDTSEICKRAR